MMKYLSVIALVSALALPAVATAGEAPTPASGPTAQAWGAMIYAENCAACHGANLEGQPNWRQRNADGRLPAPPHNARGHTWHHDDATLFGITKLGTAKFTGLDIESDMPAYEDVLSDAEIRAVLAFIKSKWPLRVRRQQNSINRRTRDR
jgi:mono/diheme cytochrome c family protein